MCIYIYAIVKVDGTTPHLLVSAEPSTLTRPSPTASLVLDDDSFPFGGQFGLIFKGKLAVSFRECISFRKIVPWN